MRALSFYIARILEQPGCSCRADRAVRAEDLAMYTDEATEAKLQALKDELDRVRSE
jgi:hypothetical protein